MHTLSNLVGSREPTQKAGRHDIDRQVDSNAEGGPQDEYPNVDSNPIFRCKSESM